MQQLSQSLAENLSALDARFGQSADYYAKKIVLYGCPGCIVMFDGMASLDSLWELLLDAAGRQSASVRLTGTQAYAHILHGSAFPAESTPVQDMSQLVARLTAGMAVLLLEGCSSGIVFSVQGLKFRSVEEPSAEGNLRGSREGFTDLLRVNLSLLRRLVRTDTLMQEAAQAHTCCNTEYALCYCKDRADPAMVRRVRTILQSARPELLLDSSYFVPWLLPGKARLFTPVHYTERPAVAAAKLCEGKLVILVNGSPSALVLPALFSEQFECLDDYASTAMFSSFLRVLKYFSFYLTVFLPADPVKEGRTMKKTSNRLHSLFAALAALILAAALAVPAFAVEGGFADLYYRMFDDAEVLTEDEDNELEDALEELSLRQSFDVTIATIESMESVDYDSMEAYADDLYDFCQFGYGSDMDGVLLLVSVGDRKWHISTCGYGITAFTDAGIQYLGEQMTPFMADGDYAGAFRTFVQWSDTYIDAARAGHPYDVNNLPREPLSLMYLFLALGIGLVLAWVVVHVMKSQLRSVAFQENAASYVREGSMNLTNSRELFLYRDVHRTERPKESRSSDSGGSSTHTSSSGTTHGGGGGSF